MKLLITQSSPASDHFLPLRSKYPPRHPVLRHLQSVFFLTCDRSSHWHVSVWQQSPKDETTASYVVLQTNGTCPTWMPCNEATTVSNF